MKLLTCGLFSLAFASRVLATTFNVTDANYGAKGNGVADDHPAIQACINAAIAPGAGTGNTVFLPAGTYLLKSANSTGNIFEIKNSSGLTFTGTTGTKLVSSLGSTPFLVVNSNTNAIIQNLVVDYAPLDYTQGTITAFDATAHTLTLTIDSGFDQPNRADLATATDLYTWSDPNRVGYDEYYGAHPQIRGRIQVSSGVWVLTIDWMPPHTFIGEKAVIWGADSDHAITFNSNTNITFSNFSFYNEGWNTAFIAWQNSGAINLINVNVTPPPGSGRLLSAASGMMFTGNRGTLTMDGCNWIVHRDDLLDVNSSWQHIVAHTASNKINVVPGDYQVGDAIETWKWPVNPGGGWPNASLESSATITGTASDISGNTVLTLSGSVVVITTGTGKNGANDGIDRVIDLTQAGPVIVRNGSFHASRSCPLGVKSGTSILVENCLFYDNRSPVRVGAQIGWEEGPRPINATVRNNTFSKNDTTSLEVAVEGASALNLATNVVITGNIFENNGQATICNSNTAAYGVPLWVQNAISPVIQNNLFEQNWNANIALEYDTNVQISGNTFDYPNQIQPLSTTVTPPTCVIWADTTQGLTLMGNLVSHAGPFCQSLLQATGSVSGIVGGTNGIFQTDSQFVFDLPYDSQVIDIPGGVSTPGTAMEQWSWGGGANQRWIVTTATAAPGYFTISSFANGLFLSGSGSAGTKLTQLTQSLNGGVPASSQLWSLVPVDSSKVNIVNLSSGLCVNVIGGSTSPGAQLCIWYSGSATNQIWLPVAAPFLTATAGSKSVSLCWAATAYGSKYTVGRSTTSGGPYTTIASNLTSTTYSDPSLSSGVTYYYVVTASSTVAPTYLSSNQASATALFVTPAGLIANSGSGQILIAWSSVSGASSYNIYRGFVSGAEASTPIATGLVSPGYIDPNLTNGVTYYYTVAAVSGSTISPQSAEVFASAVADGNYWISSSVSGLVLDDPGASATSGIQMVQWSFNGGANQSWHFAYQGNGVYTITNSSSGLYLTDPNGSTANGTPLQQQTQDNRNDQLWSISGNVIWNKASGLTVDDPNGSHSPGTGIDLWQSTGSFNLNWFIIPNNLAASSASWSQWQALNFSSAQLAAPAVSASNAGPAGDGIPNLAKYALGLDPFTSSTLPIIQDFETIDGTRYLRLVVNRNPGAFDATTTVEVSGDLNFGDWNSVDTTVEVNIPSTLVVRDNVPVAAAMKRFMRMKFTQP